MDRNIAGCRLFCDQKRKMMMLNESGATLAPSPTKGDESRTMRAAVLPAAGRVEIRRVAIPEPGPGEVRVRLEGCGVCASNLGPWAGPDWMEFPTGPGDLGHEGWGRVDALGPDVSGLRVGQRVATLFQKAYAEHAVGPAEEVVPLPAELDATRFPAEPLGCAINVLRRSDIRPGQAVAVVGVGFLGALLIQLCRAAGARVLAFSRRSFAQEVAHRAGAETVLPPDPAAAVAAVEALSDGALCERVIEATGKQEPLDLAARLTGVRGRLVIAGYHQDGPRSINMQLWNWRGIDVINAHERDPATYIAGMCEAVEAVREGRLDPAPLITHALPLEKLGDALDMTRDRPDGFLKAVVTMA